MVPVCKRPTYSTAALPRCTGAAFLLGFGPPGFGKLRAPRPFITSNRPSFKLRAATGYQPVGTKPSTRLRRCVTSTTATALASEQTTYKLDWSALRARAVGVMPAGWRGNKATLMVSTERTSPRSLTPSTSTRFVLAAVTKRRYFHSSGFSSFSSSVGWGFRSLHSMPVGWGPTRVMPIASPVSALC